jgi:hypothetical protein
VVRLVAALVEERHDTVADELLHLAAELAGEQRRGDPPVRVEHCRRLFRRRALGEAGVADQVAEEDADVLVRLARRR